MANLTTTTTTTSTTTTSIKNPSNSSSISNPLSNSQILTVYTNTIQALLPWLPNDLLPNSFSNSSSSSSNISLPYDNSIIPRPTKELRLVAISLNRLDSALNYAQSNSISLFSDQGSITDIKIVLQDLHEIAIKAKQNRNTRPRIRVERRLIKDRLDQFSIDDRKRIELLANRIDTLVQVAIWKSNNLNHHHQQQQQQQQQQQNHHQNHIVRQSSCHHPQQLVTVKKGRIGLGRARIGRRGRVFSNSEMGRRILSNHHQSSNYSSQQHQQQHQQQQHQQQHQQPQQNLPFFSSSDPINLSYQRHSSGRIIPSFKNSDPFEKLSSARDSSNSIPSSNDLINSSSSNISNFQYPWQFSLVENPITPLRSRTLSTANDGSIVMAMWKSQRVSVQVIRRDQKRFFKQGEYLYKLGQCPNIPSLLGGHWENAVIKSSSKSKNSRKMYNSTIEDDGNVGFLIMEVTNGTSLDKLVRDRKLTDVVSQIRILDHIVSALLFAQTLNHSYSHQDLHPSNILLVPNVDHTDCESYSDFSSKLSENTKPKPISTSNVTAHLEHHEQDESKSLSRSKRKNKLFSLNLHNQSEDNNKSSSKQKNDSLITTNPFPSSSSTTMTTTKDNKQFSLSSSSSSLPSTSKQKSSNQERPQLPKIEDVNEALTVLQRVALHNKIDELANLERKSGHSNRHGTKSRHESSRIDNDSSYKNKNMTSSSRNYHQQTLQHSRGKMHQQLPPSSVSNQSPNPLVILDDHSKKDFNSKNSIHSLSSFTVKVMDFPPISEAGNIRRKMTWTQNDSLAGYCSPERVTSSMWRKMIQKREKEKDHERSRRHSRSSSNGPNSPRPGNRRSSSNNGSGSGYITTRSGSSSNRTPFDSETYALFGDDPMNDRDDPMNERNDPTDPMGLDSDMMTNEYENKKKLRHHRHEGAIRSTNGLYHDALMPYSPDDHDNKLLIRTSDISETESGSHRTDRPRPSKVDVWSIGWILYYMSTGKHPPRDSWARKIPITDKDMRDIPLECQEIIHMCIQQDISRQAELKDVKRKLDSVLQRLMFAKGLVLLETDKESALTLLDKAVGIKNLRPKLLDGQTITTPTSSPVTPIPSANGFNIPSTTIANGEARSLEDGLDHSRRYIGLNQTTRSALAALPVLVVRRVEWEAAARYLGHNDEEISRLQAALVDQKWNKRDVIDGHAAVSYLRKRSNEGIAAAQSALGWVYRWGAGGVKVNVHEAMNQWERAIEANDPEACNGMGLMYHYGRDDIQVDGEKARKYYQRAVDLGHPAAAVNLGVMLHDGAAGLPADGIAARGLYEMACRHGNAIAANNLGLLLQHGGAGVEQDCAAAVRAYELAIEMNERHHACRNLAELLWIGASNVPRSRANSIEYFAQAIAKGDSSSRSMACDRLKKLIKKTKENDDDDIPAALVDRCNRLIATGSALSS